MICSSPATVSKINMNKKSGPSGKLAVASLVVPFLTVFVAALIYFALPPVPIEQRNSWGPVFRPGFILVAAVLVLGPATGTVLSICSLWRKERPILAVIALIINAGFLLSLGLTVA